MEIRERLGLLPDTEVDFLVEGESVRLVRRPDQREESRGAKTVRRLRGTGTVQMSTDEILALTREP